MEEKDRKEALQDGVETVEAAEVQDNAQSGELQEQPKETVDLQEAPETETDERPKEEKIPPHVVVDIRNLVKRYGSKVAVDNISFQVKRGEILGFLGPNGAGKTTTMNILTGYISSTSGSVTVAGYNILDDPDEVKKRIGYLPENPPLYMDMTVMEYLNFVYELKKVHIDRANHLKDILALVGLTHVKGRMIKNLSKGYKQRVGLAQALIGNPEVLILDEPTVGLDPKQIIEIRNVIKRLGQNRTVILSTHILQEVSAICDHVVIINNGRIAAMDSTENLEHGTGRNGKFTLRVAGDEYQVKNALSGVSGIKFMDVLGIRESGTVDIYLEFVPDKDLRKELFYALAQKDLPIYSMKPFEMTLEDVFLKATSGDWTAPQEEESPAPKEKKVKKVKESEK